MECKITPNIRNILLLIKCKNRSLLFYRLLLGNLKDGFSWKRHRLKMWLICLFVSKFRVWSWEAKL
jgi:hypothetical protein